MEGAAEDKQSSTSSTCRSGNRTMDHQESGLKERKASTNLGLFVSYIDQNQLEGSIESIYGSAAKDIEAIFELKKQRLGLYTTGSSLIYKSVATKRRQSTRTSNLVDSWGAQVASKDVMLLDDESDEKESPTAFHQPFVIDYHSGENDSPVVKPQPSIVNIDSDDECHESARPQSVHVKLESVERSASQTDDIAEDQGVYNGSPSEDNGLKEKGGDQQPSNPYLKPSYPFQDIFLALPANGFISSAEKKKFRAFKGKKISESNDTRLREQNIAGKMGNDKGVYVGVDHDVQEDDEKDKEDDGLRDIWKEMNIALESNKDYGENHSSKEESELECNHSTVLKEDIGYVCRICGLIQQSIESIFEFRYGTERTTRTYRYESRGSRIGEPAKLNGLKLSEDGFIVTDFSAHLRHRKQMKPHQVEGFNFLISNLVTENPGGCILAHAPGSGKTFLVISFIQSFLAKYPDARPMVVLPKGILATWKKEFKIWRVEDVPLYDFYSAKAESKAQQLEVLEKWVADKSILFLGYTQFSKLVCGQTDDTTIAACREILLKVPSILILDEGHTPRNDNTDVFDSLAQVRTQRKVVLSGTLYQNHVKEVFNIVNLVRPNFLKLDTSREIVRRIESKVHISGVGKNVKGNRGSGFYELVENTLQDSENLNGKVSVIQDLREMTCNILHYYKGDFLEDLPGFDDFTVLLNLNPEQQKEVKRIRKLSNFKRIAVGSAVYIHPQLKQLSEKGGDKLASDDLIDEMIRVMDMRELGAKAKFFLNMLRLCESAGEKLLVFSQYLLPLKFLERLAVKKRGWSPGKETFMISGDSSAEMREWSMERFNTSSNAKIFFGSIKACGEGISLVGASRIIILDIHLNPSVSRQAIGRAYRPGQKKKVYTYRLVAADSPEEEDHRTCFRKELISKMWFEWDKYSTSQVFMMKTVDRDQCGDEFLESPLFRDDVKALFRR